MNADTPQAIIETLNSLIQLDFDAVKTYEQALDRVVDPEVEDDLEAFLADHERHITDLAEVIRGLGGAPKEVSRDFKGILLEGMTALRSVTGTLGALKAMRMAEKLTNSTYDSALALDLPGHVRAVVMVNREDERRHLSVIATHIERLSHMRDDEEVDELALEADRADRPGVRM